MPSGDFGRLRIRTKHAELTLEEIAGALPGTGDVMAEVSHCFGTCWHAARRERFQLAAYYARRTRSLLGRLALLRPQHAERLRRFDVECLEPVIQALLAGDGNAFEAAFKACVELANLFHVETGHPYIVWEAPPRSPEDGLGLNRP